jgi:hypothetical protein
MPSCPEATIFTRDESLAKILGAVPLIDQDTERAPDWVGFWVKVPGGKRFYYWPMKGA